MVAHLPGEGLYRFYQRYVLRPSPPFLRAPELSGHRRTSTASSTASSRSEWALPNLNGELQISVGTARPQPRTLDLSGVVGTSSASSRSSSRHCWTSTATSRSQWALLNLNRELQISVGTAGPQPRAPDLSGHRGTSTATSRSQWALPPP